MPDTSTPRSSSFMRAAVLVEPGHFELQTRALPQPGPTQVRIRLEGCGVCASNIPPFEGRDWFQYPFEPGALGHEGWGEVEALGDQVKDLALGDRVAALSFHAYATHDLAERANVVVLPDALAGQALPGEPLGCAINIFRRSEIHAGDTVAIVGVGFLGALMVQLAVHAGARVIAVSRRREALELARRMGAEEVLNMQNMTDHHDVIERVEQLTDGALCDRVIEVTGHERPLDLAGELTRVRGRLIVAGYHQDSPRQVNLQLWNWRGLDVINAHERDEAVQVQAMREGVAAVLEGRLDPRSLITHRFALDELDEALGLACARPEGFMKAVVIP